jgi:hypothetical protein
MGRRLTLALFAAAAIGSVGGTPAALDRAAPVASPAFRLMSHASSAARIRTTASAVEWSGGRYEISGGAFVSVFVSPAFDASAGRSFADYLDSLVHGSELGLLRAYVATPEEVDEICGAAALGCYGGDMLVAVGEVVDGVTPQQAIAHEYGHHIAAHRLNPPWPAVDWGTKRWASHADVCARAAVHAVFPGDESSLYHLNPGEAFAEVYRVLNERRLGATALEWSLVDRSFYPDQTSLDLVEQDVRDPWTAPRRMVSTTTLARGRRSWSTSVSTPLDGDLSVTLQLRRAGSASLRLLDDKGAVVGRGLWSSGTRLSASTRVCGARSLKVRVTAAPGTRLVLTVVAP